MSMFQRTLAKIVENKDKKDNGGINCIPFSLPRLSNQLPGVMQGTPYIITANSGVGKTQLTKQLFLYDPIDFYLANKDDMNLKVHIHYYALEESEEEFATSMLGHYLFIREGITLDYHELWSRKINKNLDKTEMEALERTERWLSDHVAPLITLNDSVSHPYGIYKEAKEVSNKLGDHLYRNIHNGAIATRKEYKTYTQLQKENFVYNGYKPYDQDEYRILIVDHLSLLSTEKNLPTKHQAIGHWSAEYSRKQITKHWKWAVANVQQQAADKEKPQYTVRGASIEEKLEPSLDGLGDNKMTQRDALEIIGLFAPDRYEIRDYRGYNIQKLQDNYRSLKILKSRYASANKRLSLWYNGAVNDIKELPDHKNIVNYDVLKKDMLRIK